MAEAVSNFPKSGYVRLSQLVPSPIPVTPATIWNWVRDGDFPQPVKLSERVTAWRARDVRAWMAARPKLKAARHD